MKYLLFSVAAGVFVSIAVSSCRRSSGAGYVLFAILIISTCEPDLLGISFMTREYYGAPIRGFEIFLTDLCAMAMAAGLFFGRLRQQRWNLPPLGALNLLLIATAATSWWLTETALPFPLGDPAFRAQHIGLLRYGYFDTSLYPLFEIFRLVKGFVVFWVVANFVRVHREDRWTLLIYSVVGMWIFARALAQYALFQVPRPQAGLQHSNSMAIYVLMIGAFLLPHALANWRGAGRHVYRLSWVTCAFVVVLSASRAGLAILAVQLVAGARLILQKRPRLTPRWIVGALAVATVGLLFSEGMLERFESVSGYGNPRTFLTSQAREMALEHPFGVGLGNFSAFSWFRQDKRPRGAEAGVPAHNIWYLTAAELGLPGLCVLLAVWGRTAQLAWVTRRSASSGERLLIDGVLLALLALLLQSFVHYSYRDNAVYYLLQILAGILVGVSGRISDGERVSGSSADPDASRSAI